MNLCLLMVIAMAALVVVPLAFLLPPKEGPGRAQGTPGAVSPDPSWLPAPEALRSVLGGDMDILLLGSVLVLILLSTALLGLLNWWVVLSCTVLTEARCAVIVSPSHMERLGPLRRLSPPKQGTPQPSGMHVVDFE